MVWRVKRLARQKLQRHDQMPAAPQQQRPDMGQITRNGREHALNHAYGQKHASRRQRRISVPLHVKKRQRMEVPPSMPMAKRQHGHRNSKFALRESGRICSGGAGLRSSRGDENHASAAPCDDETADHFGCAPPAGFDGELPPQPHLDRQRHEGTWPRPCQSNGLRVWSFHSFWTNAASRTASSPPARLRPNTCANCTHRPDSRPAAASERDRSRRSIDHRPTPDRAPRRTRASRSPSSAWMMPLSATPYKARDPIGEQVARS